MNKKDTSRNPKGAGRKPKSPDGARIETTVGLTPPNYAYLVQQGCRNDFLNDLLDIEREKEKEK